MSFGVEIFVFGLGGTVSHPRVLVDGASGVLFGVAVAAAVPAISASVFFFAGFSLRTFLAGTVVSAFVGTWADGWRVRICCCSCDIRAFGERICPSN